MGVQIRYMGAKHDLAPAVADIVSELPEGPFLDLFAGMCSVAGAVSRTRRVTWCNDVQVYAQLVAEGLISSQEEPLNGRELLSILAAHCDANCRLLGRRFRSALQTERRALAEDRHGLYKQVVERWPHSTNDGEIALEMDYLRAQPESYPYRLATLAYAHGFFGLQQAIEIDSIRFGLDTSLGRGELSADQHRWGLIALLQTASHITSSPGHFAEFLNVRDDKVYGRIRVQRLLSVRDTFVKTVDRLGPYGDAAWRAGNRVYNREAERLVRELQSRVNKPRVVYADPPYSAAQYSRYYHVLETLVLYDYPPTSGAGRYRSQRHQTSFSNLGTVENAFREIVSNVSAMDACLVLSYPTNGLLYQSGADPVQLLQEHFQWIEILSTGTKRHSTLGGAPGHANAAVEEIIYVAKESA